MLSKAKYFKTKKSLKLIGLSFRTRVKIAIAINLKTLLLLEEVEKLKNGEGYVN